MKRILLLVVLASLLIGCGDIIHPRGRWNPVDPEYEAETDPDREDEEDEET